MIVAATGHRPDKLPWHGVDGYAADARAHLEAFAVTILRALNPDTVVSGMALGWDQAVGEAAIQLGIPLVAALPFGGQELTWPRESQERYRALLKKTTTIKLVCEGGYAAWKFQRRNEYLVTSSHLLVALWDGSDGGTANCVRYAERCGREMQDVVGALLSAENHSVHGGGMVNVWSRWVAVAG